MCHVLLVLGQRRVLFRFSRGGCVGSFPSVTLSSDGKFALRSMGSCGVLVLFLCCSRVALEFISGSVLFSFCVPFVFSFVFPLVYLLCSFCFLFASLCFSLISLCVLSVFSFVILVVFFFPTFFPLSSHFLISLLFSFFPLSSHLSGLEKCPGLCAQCGPLSSPTRGSSVCAL